MLRLIRAADKVLLRCGRSPYGAQPRRGKSDPKRGAEAMASARRRSDAVSTRTLLTPYNLPTILKYFLYSHQAALALGAGGLNELVEEYTAKGAYYEAAKAKVGERPKIASVCLAQTSFRVAFSSR